MSIKFPCPHCDQTLSVSSKKAGSHGKCPNCEQPVLVPAAEETSQTAANQPPPAPGENEEDSYSPFILYEDEELITDAAPVNQWVNHEKIAVPRNTLYLQGALLGTVAIVCFSLGVSVGFFTAGERNAAPPKPKPCFISGKIEYIASDKSHQADQGSVVIVLPLGKKIVQRIPIEGLRTADPAPNRNHPSVRALLELGGNYGRVDNQGEFKLRLPDVGDYYLLIISRNQKRPRGKLLVKSELAQMANYLSSGFDLVGPNQYRWQKQRMFGDRRVTTIVFE